MRFSELCDKNTELQNKVTQCRKAFRLANKCWVDRVCRLGTNHPYAQMAYHDEVLLTYADLEKAERNLQLLLQMGLGVCPGVCL